MNPLTQLAQSMDQDMYSMNEITSQSSMSGGETSALIVTFIVFYLLVVVVSYAINAWLLGRVFKKAGVPAWVAWVPGYNIWKTYQLGEQPPFMTILMFIPIVQIIAVVYLYIAMYKIGLKFGKEGWFVLLAIFVPIVWLIWLAFDDSKWQGLAGDETPANQPVDPDATTAVIDDQSTTPKV